jgi:hypothetical protein
MAYVTENRVAQQRDSSSFYQFLKNANDGKR